MVSAQLRNIKKWRFQEHQPIREPQASKNFLPLAASTILLCYFWTTINAEAQTRKPARQPLRAAAHIIAASSATSSLTNASAHNQDSLRISPESFSPETLSAASDSAKRSRRGGIDSVVTFAAQDSMTYSVKARKMRLRQSAYVKNGAQTLSAEIIELFLEQEYMKASSGRDSAGRVVGVPKFSDKNESFYGAELTYNFRTQRGTITLAETKLGDGFFFGKKVKRMDETTFYLQDGCYTTCDKPHPHFYFKSPRMKVIGQDRIYADPLIVYFSDIPIFAIPFGLFIEHKSGRRSGILIPRVFLAGAIGDANSRGVAFEDFGYYFAINDNLDAKITGSYYTKGGWLSNFSGNYVFGRRLSGSIDLAYGQGGFSPNATPTENWRVGWRHNWELTPFTRVSGSINLSSSDFFNQTQLDVRQRAQQTINSQFSISHTLDNGLPLSLNYSRVQDVATGRIDQSFTSGTNIPQIFPVRNLIRAIPSLGETIAPDSWLADIAFSYSVTARADIATPADSLPNETQAERERRRALALANPFTARISHSPSINIAPKFGFFVVQPSISYSENWYFRRIRKRTPVYSPTGALTLADDIERGFFRDYALRAGLDVSTTLYGIANPRVLGVNSLRHTLRPSVGVSYTPNFQDDDNLTGRYTDTSGGFSREVVYSRYALDGGNFASPLQANVNWSIDNNFEAKIQQDTLEKVVQLMRVQMNGSVNLAADSLQWSPIGMSFSNTFADVVQFSGSANFSLYDQDTVRSGESLFLRTANRFLAESGKGLARLNNINFNLAYRLSGNTANNSLRGGLQASGSTPTTPKQNDEPAQTSEDAALGARFQQRIDNSYDRVDVFGDQTPGYAPLDLEWSADVTGTFSYAPAQIVGERGMLSALLTADVNLTLDRLWRFQTRFSLDVFTGEVVAPTLNLSRDLHCWDLSFRWQPFGVMQGYFFRVGIKMPQLRDVQITKQDNAFYRQ